MAWLADRISRHIGPYPVSPVRKIAIRRYGWRICGDAIMGMRKVMLARQGRECTEPRDAVIGVAGFKIFKFS